MISMLTRLTAAARHAIDAIEQAQPLALLAARLYGGAGVLPASGLTKLRDWDTTLALFEDEYHVPLLPHRTGRGDGHRRRAGAARAAGPRPGRAFRGRRPVRSSTLVAVVSLADIAPAALQQHVFWGSLLLGRGAVGRRSAGRWTGSSRRA
jgi:putative oxidoreductase